MKCEICKENEADEKLVMKDVSILDKKTGEVKEWKLCTVCFNLWANQDFDELSKRLKE